MFIIQVTPKVPSVAKQYMKRQRLSVFLLSSLPSCNIVFLLPSCLSSCNTNPQNFLNLAHQTNVHSHRKIGHLHFKKLHGTKKQVLCWGFLIVYKCYLENVMLSMNTAQPLHNNSPFPMKVEAGVQTSTAVPRTILL